MAGPGMGKHLGNGMGERLHREMDKRDRPKADPEQRAPGYLAGSTVAEGTRRAVTQVARVPFFAITDPV